MHHDARRQHARQQTTLYRLVQQHAATFFERAEAGADLPQFVKDEFDALLACGILAHGFLRLRCRECGDDRLVAFRCKRRRFCCRAVPGAWRRRRRTAPFAYLADDSHEPSKCSRRRTATGWPQASSPWRLLFFRACADSLKIHNDVARRRFDANHFAHSLTAEEG